MSFKHITSRDNSIFKQLKKLAESARERKAAQQTLLDGVHLIEEYRRIFGDPELMIIPEGKSTLEATHLMQQLSDVNTVMFSTLMFAELSPVTNSSGILALIKIPTVAAPPTVGFALLLEDIQDPGNMGNLLRTALGAGVDTVYCSKACVDVWSPKCLRGGQGAQFHLPVVTDTNLLDMIKRFPGRTYATTLNGESLYAQDLTLPSAFVIGNEGAGLSPALINAASHRVSIPINQKLESLNAATAAAICLFERQRQLRFAR